MSGAVVHVGDVRQQLAAMPDESVQCVVTSPPYWGLRDYGVAGQLGLEPTPEEFLTTMVDVFRDVRRVLRADGTMWLNIGDSYAATTKGGGGTGKGTLNCGPHHNAISTAHQKTGPRAYDIGDLKPKDLVGIPWRLALALQADGWYLRSDIIWAKPNPMPESVTDRPTKAHEYVFLLTKSARYFYDADAVREVSVSESPSGNGYARPEQRSRAGRWQAGKWDDIGGQRNARTVWTIATAPYPDAHFATFPLELPARCIRAGTKEGDTVLDPFSGAGTTGLAALRLGRDYVGIELSPEYAEMSRKRLAGDQPLFSAVRVNGLV